MQKKLIPYILLSSIHVSSQNCLLLLLCFELSFSHTRTHTHTRGLSGYRSSSFLYPLSFSHFLFLYLFRFLARFFFIFVLTSHCLAIFESLKGLPNSTNERNIVHTDIRTHRVTERWRKAAHWLLWVCLSPKNLCCCVSYNRNVYFICIYWICEHSTYYPRAIDFQMMESNQIWDDEVCLRARLNTYVKYSSHLERIIWTLWYCNFSHQYMGRLPKF